MLKVLLDRKWRKDEYSIGRLYVNGELWCNTLEPTDRGLTSSMSTELIKKIKVKGKTAIPLGKYYITMSYSSKFKMELPLINDIKCFSRVLVHIGNYPKDTEACILLGNNNKVGMVSNSTFWVKKFVNKVKEAINHGEMVILEVI